jgi:small-conductance mechanosensitive channel
MHRTEGDTQIAMRNATTMSRALIACSVYPAAVALSLFFLSPPLLAEDSQAGQSPTASTEPPPGAPELADLIPLSTALSDRLATLKRAVADQGDLSGLDSQLKDIATRVDQEAQELETLKESTDSRAGRLPQLAARIGRSVESLDAIAKTVTAQVRTFGNQQKEWLAEQAHWNTWQAALRDGEPLEEVTAAVENAQRTIASALALLRQQLKPLLGLQEHVATLQSRVNTLTAEAQELLSIARNGGGTDMAPPIFSAAYASQLAAAVRGSLRTGLVQASWSDQSLIAGQGWILALQALLSLGLTTVFVRSRKQLEHIDTWRFIARRPIAAGVLVGVLSPVVLYERPPDILRLALSAIVAVAFVRLLGGLVQPGWRHRLVYGLATIAIVNNLCYALELPVALFRFYLLLAAAVSLITCLRWAAESRRTGEARICQWTLLLAALVFAAVLIAELSGRAALAEFLFVASLRTLAVVLVFGLLRHLAHGGLEWVVNNVAARRVALVRNNAATLVPRLSLFMDVLIGTALLAVLLMTWQVYDSPSAAISRLLTRQVGLGSQQITIGIVLLAVGSLGASYVASSLLQTLLAENVLARRNVDTGVSVAVTRLLHYALLSIGFVIALVLLGVDLTKVTLLVSALGVGIGFGLQTIINNFFCGLILLFERPLRVGDTIELGGRWAKIAKIGLRSTTVRTLDQADVIVPNADLITHQVTNWTLTDRHARSTIAVKGVAGSDVAVVMQTLKECALAQPGVMKNPEPQVFFRNFDGGTLDFDMLIGIVDVDNRLQVESDLRRSIECRFREGGIEIPS